MSKALSKRIVDPNQALMIGALAGVAGSLLPSVPMIVKYWNDDTPVTIFGKVMPYKSFLRGWLITSGAGLFFLIMKLTERKQH